MALRLCDIPKVLSIVPQLDCRRASSSGSESANDGILYPGHVPTSPLQKMLLFAGSAVAGLTDPWRSDMVAVNGEVAGEPALNYMLWRMQKSSEGRLVLAERPRITTKTVDYKALEALPEKTLGNVVARFNRRFNITPDSRDPVRFVDDAELAYVMQRYREVHDLLHALFDMPTDIVGELAVKWVEALQFGLPMCVGAALLGPARLKKHSQLGRYQGCRSWAIHTGMNSRFLLNVYYEQRWEQDIDDLRRELKIVPPPRTKK